MSTIINPILPGFNPDPCILRVEDTYYIAVSSFEWLPGIRIYASKDLVNWSHETDILTDQADL
ncbi:TPA: glycoside hydrolase family 43 protein, partial [Enterococcus faecium]|nr:glycoside hydrolase family 43 protein [Enterococcus faecium]